MGTGSFLGVKLPGYGVDHLPPFSVAVKERVELYIYCHLWALVACYRMTFTCTFIPSYTLGDCNLCNEKLAAAVFLQSSPNILCDSTDVKITETTNPSKFSVCILVRTTVLVL
jgi:hypothetical protein